MKFFFIFIFITFFAACDKNLSDDSLNEKSINKKNVIFSITYQPKLDVYYLGQYIHFNFKVFNEIGKEVEIKSLKLSSSIDGLLTDTANFYGSLKSVGKHKLTADITDIFNNTHNETFNINYEYLNKIYTLNISDPKYNKNVKRNRFILFRANLRKGSQSISHNSKNGIKQSYWKSDIQGIIIKNKLSSYLWPNTLDSGSHKITYTIEFTDYTKHIDTTRINIL